MANHPLPIGTVFEIKKDHTDTGVMSWDATDTEIERRAVAGSKGVVTAVVQTSRNSEFQYHVEFIPSEVWNIIDQAEFDNDNDYKIVSLGDGQKPDWFTEYYDNPDRERDPAAIAQIEEETGLTL